MLSYSKYGEFILVLSTQMTEFRSSDFFDAALAKRLLKILEIMCLLRNLLRHLDRHNRLPHLDRHEFGRGR